MTNIAFDPLMTRDIATLHFGNMVVEIFLNLSSSHWMIFEKYEFVKSQ